MPSVGLLVLTSSVANLPSKLSLILHNVSHHVKNILYIQLFPGRTSLLRDVGTGSLEKYSPQYYSRIVNNIYNQAGVTCQQLDVRVILGNLKHPESVQQVSTSAKISVVIFEHIFKGQDMRTFVKDTYQKTDDKVSIVTLEHDPLSATSETADADSHEHDIGSGAQINENSVSNRVYDHVVAGGTFDKLHTGHKVLLSEGVLRCSKDFLVGVSDGALVEKKKLHELMEPCINRMQHLHDFLLDVDPSLTYRIIPITDPFGPTRDDPDFQMIVVSEETHRGAVMINDARRERGLSPLDVYTIPVIRDECRQSDVEEDKVSSSSMRMRRLGQRLKEPPPRPHLPFTPYVIGLTGSIASGKSSICRTLERLGAVVIDCDKLGHEVYAKGNRGYYKVVEAFGEAVLDTENNINRRALGTVVFGDKKNLARLNALVWPEIGSLVQQRIRELQKKGHPVVVLDAAVLLEANWDSFCHEIWVSIIPRNEAVKRIVERNKLSTEEAEQRISCQLTNAERVAKATVVFSSFWAPEYTQTQVEQAWQQLSIYLRQKKV